MNLGIAFIGMIVLVVALSAGMGSAALQGWMDGGGAREHEEASADVEADEEKLSRSGSLNNASPILPDILEEKKDMEQEKSRSSAATVRVHTETENRSGDGEADVHVEVRARTSFSTDDPQAGASFINEDTEAGGRELPGGGDVEWETRSRVARTVEHQEGDEGKSVRVRQHSRAESRVQIRSGD